MVLVVGSGAAGGDCRSGEHADSSSVVAVPIRHKAGKVRFMDSSLDSHGGNAETGATPPLIDGAVKRRQAEAREETVAKLRPIAAGDVIAYDAQPGAANYRRAMTVLTVALLVGALGGAVRLPRNDALLAVLLCTLFAFGYAMAVTRVWRNLAWTLGWLAGLTIIWILMLPVLPVSVYLVFPLFFLYLRALPDYRGMIAVVGATAVAILSYRTHLTYGAVMGPMVSALVVIGIHLAFQALWKGARERETLIEELIATRSQLAETERAAGVAKERQRIAHEIHDTLAQGLSSIQMLLRVAEGEIATSTLSDAEKAGPLKYMELARQTAADNLSEARAMIAALQPAALSKTSLEGALHRVSAGFVGIEWRIEIVGDERQLPMKTEAGLLRIAQGAMGNVSKHANASRCAVTLTYEEDEVRLDIVDDGMGFDPTAVAEKPVGLGHIGIDAMRQRAAELGGTLEVESAPGEGTAVTVAIPVAATTGD